MRDEKIKYIMKQNDKMQQTIERLEYYLLELKKNSINN